MRSRIGWVTRQLRRALPLLAVGASALILALILTPAVTVSVFGQTVDVGAVAPSIDLGFSGPGEADLFGEGTLDTVQHFNGPIRPRLVWQRFNRNDAAGQFIQSTTNNGRRVVATHSSEVGKALQRGWVSYFQRLLLFASLFGGLIYLLAVGLHAVLSGESVPGRRRQRVARLTASILVSAMVAAACTALTVVGAARQLGSVQSLADLVGTVGLVPVPSPVGPVRTDVNFVVLGDSTAAGIGNRPITQPTVEDTACRRSADAYALVLAQTNNLSGLNLACSSATIERGVLGVQTTADRALFAQFGVLRSITSASVVIVSVGANDVGWSDSIRLCYGLASCDDQATDRLFQRRLDTFKIQYSQLLQQLGDLPNHPTVIVSQYYNPLGRTFNCAGLRDPAAPDGAGAGYGFEADPGLENQAEKIRRKVEPLEGQLARLNAVLAQGASAFGALTAQPRFDGHELCSAQPWVQGMNDPAPFHPTAAGELAIATAIQTQLPQVVGANP